MIISTFIFFNEIDLLRLRIAYEYPTVDHIVITEATRTFAGRDKLLYFERYRDLFAPYLDKIEYVVVDDLPAVREVPHVGWNGLRAHEYRWHLEWHQRDCILRGLTKINPPEDAVVVHADLDEIISVDALRTVEHTMRQGEIHYPFLWDYRYAVSKPPASRDWSGPYATQYRHLLRSEPASLRLSRPVQMNRFHWRSPFNNLKILRRRARRAVTNLRHALSPGRPAAPGPEPNNMDIRRASGGTPIDAVLLAAGITRGVELRNAGWHLSMMNGGYDTWTKLKVENFAHAELQGSAAVEDTTTDAYQGLCRYIDAHRQADAYDYDSVHPSLPDFIRHNIRDFPILLRPK